MSNNNCTNSPFCEDDRCGCEEWAEEQAENPQEVETKGLTSDDKSI